MHSEIILIFQPEKNPPFFYSTEVHLNLIHEETPGQQDLGRTMHLGTFKRFLSSCVNTFGAKLSTCLLNNYTTVNHWTL